MTGSAWLWETERAKAMKVAQSYGALGIVQKQSPKVMTKVQNKTQKSKSSLQLTIPLNSPHSKTDFKGQCTVQELLSFSCN